MRRLLSSLAFHFCGRMAGAQNAPQLRPRQASHLRGRWFLGAPRLIFDKVKGVTSTTPLISAAGSLSGYEQSTGGTGPREAVEVIYDRVRFSYEQLLTFLLAPRRPTVKTPNSRPPAIIPTAIFRAQRQERL